MTTEPSQRTDIPSPGDANDVRSVQAQLRTLDGSAVDPTTRYERGVVVGVEKLPIASVPSDYPVTFESPEALQLTVEIEHDRQTAIYFDWPDQLERETPLVQFLEAHGHAPETFADIFGEEIRLERVRHFYVPTNRPMESSENRFAYWHLPLGLVIALSAISWLPGQQFPTVLVTVALWLSIPFLTYFDCRYVADRTAWSPSVDRWVGLSCLPIVRILAAARYFHRRAQATASQ